MLRYSNSSCWFPVHLLGFAVLRYGNRRYQFPVRCLALLNDNLSYQALSYCLTLELSQILACQQWQHTKEWLYQLTTNIDHPADLPTMTIAPNIYHPVSLYQLDNFDINSSWTDFLDTHQLLYWFCNLKFSFVYCYLAWLFFGCQLLACLINFKLIHWLLQQFDTKSIFIQ